jgi:hypothetical protein
MRFIFVFLCFLGLIASSCDQKPVLKEAIQNRSIGVLSVVWNPRVKVTGRDLRLSLDSRHTEALTDAFLRGLVTLANSWVRDASSVVLQEALSLYPDAPPPRKDGLALSVVSGYKWVDLSTVSLGRHWCNALNVDTVVTVVCTPRVTFVGNDFDVVIDIEFTVFNKQEDRVYRDALTVPIPMSNEDKQWVLGDIRRFANVLISHDVVVGLSHLYEAPSLVPTKNAL